MKKILSLIIVGIFVTEILTAGALSTPCIINNEKTNEGNNEPIWQWAKSGGGVALDSCKDLAVDKNGNVYIAGLYNTQATFGPFALNSLGYNDAYVAKLDKYGNWLWVVSAGGELGNDEVTGIALDDNGNIIITGHFFLSANFGNITLTSLGLNDIFVAKLDTNGNWLWAVRAGAYVGESCFGIAIDYEGNGYITGVFRWQISFGAITLSNPSQFYFDIFVAKLDLNGNWLWATSGGGELDEFVCDIAVDANQNTYITGDFYGNATFGDDNLTGQGNVDVFVAKLDNNGRWLWAISGGSPSIERGYDIVLDSGANVYVTGCFWASLTFETTTLICYGWSDAYVLKLDNNGKLLWVVGTGTDTSLGAWGIALDKNEDPYIVGEFGESATIGISTINSQGYKDIFVTKLDKDGNWQWAVSAGGPGFDQGYSLAVDNNGHVYVAGTFEQTATFGTTVLTYEGAWDLFIAELNFAPYEPKIDGPSKIKIRVSQEYRFLTSDLENDDISEYIVNWGDGEDEVINGPFTSGEPIIISHTWKTKGYYFIKAKAKDIYGAESPWATIEIIVPRNRQIILLELFEMILEKFPNAFPLLRQIINNFHE